MFLLVPTHSAKAQALYYDEWAFGDSAGIDFQHSLPQAFSSASTTYEGCASICDPRTGQLLFYTNGENIWNRSHKLMPNGVDLYGHTSSTQSSLIVPLPGSNHLYYLFTADAGPYIDRVAGINYSIVDMHQDNGSGDVVVKNIPLLKQATEKLVGVRHCNGRDFWIVAHELGTQRFVSWKLTAAGIVDTVSSSVGRAYNSAFSSEPSIGYLKASPDGRYLFASSFESNFGELFEFDNSNGVVGQPIAELVANYGASFSPNSRYLYTVDSSGTLERYVVAVPRSVAIQGTRQIVAHPTWSMYAMQLGPDGNMYIASGAGVALLKNPDMDSPVLSSPISYSPFSWNHQIFLGLPNCIDGFLGNFDSVKIYDNDTAKIWGKTVLCSGTSTQLYVENGSQYRWRPSVGLSCDDCPNPIATPDSTTTYTLTYYRSKCAGFDSAHVTITVNPSPEIDAGEDMILCSGESVQLRAISGKDVSLQWWPSTTLSCDDCPEPVATPTERTTYYVRAITSAGCVATDSVTVETSNEKILVSSDTTICFGKSVQLSAVGRKEYRWTPSEGLSCNDCPNPVATPQQTTTYIVEGTTNGGCYSNDTVVVRVGARPEAGADTTICLGDSVQLQASGGVDYFWTSSTLSGVHRPDPIAFPRLTTTYHVRVTNAFGCIAWDSVTVTVENNGSVLATGDTAFCAGGTAQLLAEGASSYRWTPTIGLSCEDCPDPKATPTETTTYYVLGSNANGGCPALDSVTVVVHDFPIAEAGEGGAVCLGEHVQLNASGGARYRWDASIDLSCEDCPDPKVTPTKTMTYYLTVWNAEGCSSRDSVEVVVHPDLVVVAGEAATICSGKSVELRAEGGVRWEWSPSEGLSCTDCQNPVAMPSATTMYRVRAWNAEGCEAEDSVEVKVREEAEVIRLRIGRNHHGGTGEEVVIPIEVVEGFGETDISELELRIEYNASMMRLDEESFQRLLVGTALEGWSVEIQGYTHKDILLRFVAPAGETLLATNPFLLFQLQLYLSSERGSELAFSVESDSKCFTIETTPGYAEVDSICGLSFRLIETTLTKYIAPVVYPNPASNRMQFAFGLGLDGRAVLEVFDVQGRRVGLLVDGELASGQYSVEWDVRGVESGQYWYRLTSGDWIQSGQVRVQK